MNPHNATHPHTSGTRVSIIAMILTLASLPAGCDRAGDTAEETPPSQGAGNTEPAFTSQDARADAPDSVNGLIERGRNTFLSASTKGWQERLELYQQAWHDFRKAHELAGGTWDFEFVPWEQTDIDKSVALMMHYAATSDDKGSARALTEAARMCMRLFRRDLGTILMDRAQRIDPNDPFVRISCLQLEGLATGEWARINSEIKNLIEDPALRENYTAWFIYGFGLMSGGDLVGAEAAYRKCLELDPEEPGARSNLSTVLAAQDKLEEAAALRAKFQKDEEPAVYADLNYGYTLMSKGKFEEAIPVLESVTQRAPGLPAGWFNLAGCYQQAKRYDQAVQVYQYYTQLLPRDATGFGLLAYTYMLMGKYDDAIETLKHAEQLPTATYSIQLALADALKAAGRAEDAEKAMIRAYQMDPTAEAVWNMYGSYLHKQKRNAELIEAATRIIEKMPSAAPPYYWRSVAHVDLGDYERALSDRVKYAELASNAEGFLFLGFTLKLAGRSSADVIAALEDALKKYPGHAYASAMLWIVEHDAGDAARAERAVRVAIAKAKPDNWYGRLNRYLAGEISQDELLGFAANDDELCEAYYFIGEKIRITKDFDAAREWFEKCLALGKQGFWEDLFSRQQLERNK